MIVFVLTVVCATILSISSAQTTDYLIVSTSNYFNLAAIDIHYKSIMTASLLNLTNIIAEYKPDLRGIGIVCIYIHLHMCLCSFFNLETLVLPLEYIKPSQKSI